MKSPFNDGKFINKRNFWVEQAPSAEVIYNDTSSLSIIQQIPKETKHRDIISRSTSNKISQAQEFNLPDILLSVRVENQSAESKWSYL